MTTTHPTPHRGLSAYLPNWLRPVLGHCFDAVCRVLGYDRLEWERKYNVLEHDYNRLRAAHEGLIAFHEKTTQESCATELRSGVQEGLYIPSVDDFWAMSRAYPIYRKEPLYNLLKSYGNMVIRDYIDRVKPGRVLEFGHGVWTDIDRCILQSRQDSVELWAVDDYAEYNYLSDRDWWEKAYLEFKQARPHVHFVQAYLGESSPELPEEHFDLICSVSVLEELSLEVSRKVLKHCYSLLKPGGKLIFSWDIKLQAGAEVARSIAEIIHSCGYRCPFSGISPPTFPLRENQLQVILWYQQHQGEDRQYWGEYSTIVVQAYKPAS